MYFEFGNDTFFTFKIKYYMTGTALIGLQTSAQTILASNTLLVPKLLIEKIFF